MTSSLWHQQLIVGRALYDNERVGGAGNPGYRREQVFRFEQTSLGVPGGYPNRDNKYVVGYTGLRLGGDALSVT